jgi:hypothetical protein
VILTELKSQFESIERDFAENELIPVACSPSVRVRLCAEIIVGSQTFRSIYDANKYLESLNNLPEWGEWAAAQWPDLMPLMAPDEFFAELGWIEDKDAGVILCRCGEEVKVLSFFGGASCAMCPVCRIDAVNLTAPQMNSSSSISIPDFQDKCRIADGEQKVWVLIHPEQEASK